MPDLDLNAIKTYTDAATGPRLLVGHKSWAGENAVLTEEGHPVAIFGHGDVAKTDSVFFARARADVPALVAEVERLRASVEQHMAALAAAVERRDAFKARCEQQKRDHALTVAALGRLLAAEKRLRAAHPRVEEVYGPECRGCGNPVAGIVSWPCPTIRAWDGGAS